MNKRALIAMSGGVDSSVAAFLMKEQGFDCAGATMKLFSKDDIGASGESRCCSVDDVADARSVAARIGIPHFVFNFSDDFREKVIAHFVRSYLDGETPNPCIDCNKYLKFEKFFQRAKELYYDHIVTGHYAVIEKDSASGRFILKKGEDRTKDQSYVLYGMTQEQLEHTVLPLGTLKKSEVREIAEAQGFLNAKKHESQDICFVPDGRYAEFIERNTGVRNKPGNFVGTDGEMIARHQGIVRYTIGQRKKLGISLREPLFVCAKNAEDNTVVLGKEERLFSKALIANAVNLIACDTIKKPLRVKAKTRYRQPEQWATAEQTGPDELRVEFDEPLRAIAPGQAVVMYDGDTVVGGGTIRRAGNDI